MFENNEGFCEECELQCTTCVTSSNNCESCSENRDIIPTCDCISGKFENADGAC